MKIDQTTVGIVIGALGSVAACIAIGYAHATVRLTRKMRIEAREWRQEDAADRQRERDEAARAHDEQIAQLRRLQEDGAAAHEQEMAQRRAAIEGERRLARISACHELVNALVAFLTQMVEPPKMVDSMPPIRSMLLGTYQSQVKMAYLQLQALGGPEIRDVRELFVDSVVMKSDGAAKWFSNGSTALNSSIAKIENFMKDL